MRHEDHTPHTRNQFITVHSTHLHISPRLQSNAHKRLLTVCRRLWREAQARGDSKSRTHLLASVTISSLSETMHISLIWVCECISAFHPACCWAMTLWGPIPVSLLITQVSSQHTHTIIKSLMHIFVYLLFVSRYLAATHLEPTMARAVFCLKWKLCSMSLSFIGETQWLWQIYGLILAFGDFFFKKSDHCGSLRKHCYRWLGVHQFFLSNGEDVNTFVCLHGFGTHINTFTNTHRC